MASILLPARTASPICFILPISGMPDTLPYKIGCGEAGAPDFAGVARSSSGTMTVLPQNWHCVLAAPSSTPREAPQDGQAKTVNLGIGSSASGTNRVYQNRRTETISP